MKKLLTIPVCLGICLLTYAAFAADLPPGDQALVDALEAALVQPLSWQVLGGALGALALWAVRSWKQIAAIDTKKEALALLVAVGTPSAAALSAGSPWQVVVVGAVAAFMMFVRLNSAGGQPLPPDHKDEPLKKSGAAIVIALLLTGCAGCAGVCETTKAGLVVAEEKAYHRCLELSDTDQAEACGYGMKAAFDAVNAAVEERCSDAS